MLLFKDKQLRIVNDHDFLSNNFDTSNLLIVHCLFRSKVVTATGTLFDRARLLFSISCKRFHFSYFCFIGSIRVTGNC